MDLPHTALSCCGPQRLTQTHSYISRIELLRDITWLLFLACLQTSIYTALGNIANSLISISGDGESQGYKRKMKYATCNWYLQIFFFSSFSSFSYCQGIKPQFHVILKLCFFLGIEINQIMQ